ncbi:MAG: Tim44 domain-containing protein, partial [Proteobacteria bacterium]|nr:Tim44 domain-containing protein [Pseudomonadota bacterium]
IHLCIEYPIIGIPLTMIFIGFLIARWWMGRGKRRVAIGAVSPSAPPRRAVRAAPGLSKLRQLDGGFSLPVLYDYLQLVHRRCHEAIVGKKWELLAPFASEQLQQQLTKAHGEVEAIDEVVLGATRIVRVDHRGKTTMLMIDFESTRLECRQGKDTRMFVVERWVFRRSAGASSLPPEEMLAMGCPSCGASAETTKMGACTHCGTAINKGQLQWQGHIAKIMQRKAVTAPEVGLFAGGDEPSVHLPTVVDPSFSASVRKFQGRHPDFDIPAFHKHVQASFHKIQGAWSQGKWDQARPFVTDSMYQTLRFWMERYTAHGLQNKLEDVRMTKQQMVKTDADAWYEAITVRLWGSMKDSVVNREGKVIGGNARKDRHFSEYWTYIRVSGTGAASSNPNQCPSCGAPLDKVNQAGICGYCSTKITTGNFDWVLSRIDQCESYAG